MRSRVFVSAALAVVLAAGGAFAQALGDTPSKVEMEKAHQAYSDGEAAYRLGHYDQAAARYEEAYRLIRFPTMLFDIGQAYRRWYEADKNVDHLRKALEMYRGFLRDAPTAKQRPVAERLVPELARTIESEARRKRADLIVRATGREGLFLADQLVAENAAVDAALVLERLVGSRQNPRDVVMAAYEKRGLVAGALGKTDLAVESFRRALVLDPGFLLPEDTEKPTRESFEKAKASLAGTRPLQVTHIPTGEIKKGQAARVEVRLESDPLDLVDSLGVVYRSAAGGAFSTVRAKKDQTTIELPASFVSGLAGGAKIEYYVVAYDALDNELALEGAAKEPFVIAIAADPVPVLAPIAAPAPQAAPPTPAYKRWWLWTLLGGAVLVGGSLGFYFGTRPATTGPTQVGLPTQ